MQKTSLFAGEAVFDSEVIREAINSLTVRLSPSDVVSQKVYSDTFFRNRIHSGSSFPSAHTIAAVSIATVVARRYSNHRWVPWVAYGLAGAIGFSRITLLAHFPSDVFVGGVLGHTNRSLRCPAGSLKRRAWRRLSEIRPSTVVCVTAHEPRENWHLSNPKERLYSSPTSSIGGHPWRFAPASAWAPTKSSLQLAQAGWARCTAPATRA